MRTTRKKENVNRWAEDTESDDDILMEFDNEPPVRSAGTSSKASRKAVKGSSSSSNRKIDEDEDEEASLGGAGGSGPGSPTPPTSTMVVEKILGLKIMIDKTGATPNEEFFLIKWKGSSYLHVSWELQEDIEAVDAGGKTKIRRYLQQYEGEPPVFEKKASVAGSGSGAEGEDNLHVAGDEEDDFEYFNPEFVEVDRIISCDKIACVHRKAKCVEDLEAMVEGDSEGSQDSVLYLVKWRGLPYNECTWEEFRDLHDSLDQIFDFWKRQVPGDDSKACSDPSLHDYKKLSVSPYFGSGDEETGLRLRDYQLEGVNWLLWNWWHKRPCILADEMGLGKTIQTICFLCQLRNMKSTNLRGPHLIVSPLSLLRQWESELTTWAPDINCIVLHGNGEARDLILEHEFYYQEPFVSKAEAAALKRASSYKFDVILTTYEVVMRDLRVFQKIDWKMLIVDEAHKLKNNTSKIYEMMISIPREHCVMLTGTPLQNKTEELWALLHFADSRKFNDLGEFSRQFGDMRGASDVAQFHAVVKPFLLRRIKEDVEKSLPPKEEIIIEVTLTKMQKQFYRAIYERNTAFLFRGAKASNGPSLMNVTMELRKCCNHPYLVKGGEERAVAEIPEALRHDSTALHNKLIESCGKMVLLDKLLPRLYKEGHKVLIFSQMVRVLNLLEDFLRYRGYTFERLDGTSRSMDRHTSVERFKNRSNNIFVMLLSTKAGGLGLNLTAADTVIIYDSDWNPHNDMQAQARAHRIGQTRSVSIYRLITKKTYEMHMFHRASLKLGLDRAVLAHARSEQEGYESSKNPSTKEIDELLKRGAYDVFREDDTEQNEFVEADIDSIMQMSSHKIVYGSNSESNISSSLGGFSKASFVSADSTEDVDINDPEFWWKTMRLVEKPVEGTMGVSEDGTPFEVGPDGELIPLQRRRRQPQMYGTDGTAMSELDKLLNDGNSEDGEKRESKKEQRERELKTWGPHSRDRMIRTLLQYGFGRWERIRKEGGAANRELSMVESLARFYVMQCGLAAGEADPNKADSPFVVDAINAAKHLQTLMASSEKSIEIPEALMEKRFQDKLKSGTARKSLMRLDFLHQLNQMISKTVHSVYESNKDTIPTPETIDMETSMTTLPIHLLANNIPLGDIRPAWTKVSPWWDDECDRHLIIGTYIYGYGKYAEMRKDSRLCFHDKITKYAQANKEAAVHDGVEAGHAVSSIYDDSAVSTFKISEDGTQCRIVIPNGRTSLFKGVFSQQGSVCWTAQIGDQQPVVIGCYNTELDAAKAYVDVAKKQGIDTTEAEKLITAAVTNADSPPLTEAPPLASGHRASKYRGVRTSGTKWTAQIFYGGTNHHLGTFATEIEAAVVYDAAAVDNHGEGATLNFNQDPSLLRKEIEFISKQPGVTIEYFSPGVEPPIVVKREAREAAFPVQADSENTEHVDLEGSNEDGEEGDDIVMFSNVKNESAGQGAKNASQKKRNRQAFSAGVDSVATLPVPAPALEMPSGVPANEGDDFDDAQGGEEQDTGGGLPDVRTLNRLLTWLVTSEAAQMSRKQIRENRAKAREKGDRTRGPGDPALMSEKREMRMKMKLAEERRGYSTTGEFGLIHHALVQSDPDSVILAYKKSLIAKCEEMVHLTMPMPTHYYAALGQLAIEDSQFMNGVTVSGRTPLRNISSVHFASTTGVNSEAVSGPDEAMQGAGSNSAASGTGAKRASMDTYVEDNTVFLSDEEVQRICAAFVVYGAPPVRKSMDLNDVFSRQYLDGVPTSYVNVSDDVALRLYSISLAMRIPEQVLQAIGIYDLDQNSRSMWPHHNIYSWRAFKLRCATCLTPIELQRFYEDHWLPFCFAVLNPPPSNTTANKLHLPNPFFRATDHSSTVRGVVEVFLLRQHVLYSIRFVTWNMMYDLIIFLRSPAGRTHMERPYFESPFPVWWCPWIHDVALLLGCLKHGYMALEAIMLDPELPFFRPILQDHIRRVFLIGFEGMPPAAPPGSFRDGWEAELWVQQVSLMMPEMRDLENRMLFVLTRVTARLPQHHFAYVRTAGSQPLTPAEHEMSLHIDQGRYPGVPMASYLDATSKRRRMDIQERFQDAMSRY